MKIIGIHALSNPFLGHGSLTLNGRHTDNLRKLPIDLVVERINAIDSGVMASIQDGTMVLESESDFTIAGHQDVLDCLGIVATE